MSRTVLVMMLILGFAAHAQERARERGNPGEASARERARDTRAEEREEHRRPMYRDYVIAEPPGYVITPWGSVIFPDAPPPMGDTSTLSGAGPDVSEGPVVGSGPQVGSGPVVGPPPAGEAP